MEGWIKLHRKFLEWEWFDKDNMVKLFIYLLLSANHETQKWRGKTIERGQVLTGRKKLSADLKMTEQKIRTCLSCLENTGEITSKSTNKYSIITLCNYDTYQSLGTEINQQPNQQVTNKQPTSNQQVTTNKNVKKEKNVKNDKNKELHAKMRAEFEQHFFYEKKIEYYWEAKDAGALKSIITKLRKATSDENNISNDEKIFEAWQAILKNIHNKWINDNLSMTLINSKYNQIVAAIVNQGQGSGLQEYKEKITKEMTDEFK